MKFRGVRAEGTAIFVASFLTLTTLSVVTAFADDDGAGPHIHEERHSLEGLPIALVILALIVAVGLAYGIGRRSRK
jgi:hypothetical protein